MFGSQMVIVTVFYWNDAPDAVFESKEKSERLVCKKWEIECVDPQ